MAFRFDSFVLDPRDRRLTRDGATVELNARYLDALILLVGEEGRLVSKDRFLDEVWRGVPVTDEALTQCIKTLRQRLGDSAGRPRFIETAPKHGYRFIAPVERIGERIGERIEDAPATPAPVMPGPAAPWLRVLGLGLATGLGGGVAGALGGVLYGLVAAAAPGASGGAALSTLLVLACVGLLLGVAGGAGVGLGVAATTLATGRPGPGSILGGAGGGLIVGAGVKLVGLDAFDLLFGQAPERITGAWEGLLLGGAVGLGCWFAGRGSVSARRGALAAALAGGAAGVLIALSGGRLFAGSLDLLAESFPGSRLRLDGLGAAFGEAGLGPVAHAVTAGLEGALFAACAVGAAILLKALGGARSAAP